MQSIKTAAEVMQADYNLQKVLDTPGGLEKFASEMLPTFIKETRDYQSFARQVLLVHNITGDQVQMINNEPYFYYSKDLNSQAAFYGDDGQIPRYQIEGSGVNVGIITIASDDTTIHLKRLMVERFNYLDRVKELSGQSVAKAEDIKLLDLTESLILGTSNDPKKPQFESQVVTTADTTLSKAHLVSLKKCISEADISMTACVMNQVHIDDILEWGTDEIDQLTQREILESGAKYSLWGTVKLIPSRTVRKYTVYGYADKEYVGRMPILKDLTVKLTQTQNKLEQGLFMFEFIGMYLASQYAIAKLIMNFAEGDDKVTFYDETVIKAKEIKITGTNTLESES